jgi:hypothetical protein
VSLRSLIAAGGVACGLALGAVAAGAGAPPVCETGTHAVLQPPRPGVLLGAFPSFSTAERNEDAVSARRLRSFEARSGRTLAWATFSNHWDRGRLRFPTLQVRLVWAEGVLPVVRSMPWSAQTEGAPDPLIRLRDVADGRWDDQLVGYARAARDAGVPLMIDFAPEMNGDWFPWSGALSGGAAGARAYRDAYRRVVGIFRREGASNVGFAFHVDAEPSPAASWNTVRAYYPGDAYVDWVGASVYGADDVTSSWQPFAPSARRVLRAVRAVAPGKPFAIFEWGVVESDRGDKGAWIRAAFRALRTDAELRCVPAIGWWDERWQRDDGRWNDLRISSSASALTAYRAGVAERRYGATPSLRCARDG